ncbi:DUF1622 domain-containing protein [Nodosilinea sp. LEGE 07088]|uniref:DUF1622 domain-containing protein n=1 Tax=Nodosilinea sp. LEGE 07088 TaxID=2777968 RepID=UPI00187DDAEC|nr:DUF1622 domain-containing protein [Nodosilinea sp. LEGE 07088]MBE9140726.1 DUF1622 domain-containing protein [Nodosilinea sp. LEGE 07088]
MSLDVVGTEISTLVSSLNGILTSLCQLLALFVIAIGVTRALLIFLKDALLGPQTPDTFQRSRLAMGYSFSLGLSFLIGATILKTMISSRWDDIARLAAIIAVRTLLNYLLLQAIDSSNSSSSPDRSLSSGVVP